MTKRTQIGSSDVPVSKTRSQIMEMIDEQGGKKFAWDISADDRYAAVLFELKGRSIRFLLKLPNAEDYQLNAAGARMGATQSRQIFEKAQRLAWRKLLYTIEGKLLSIAEGIEILDEAFAAQIVRSGGWTLAEATNDTLPAALRAALPGSPESARLLPGKVASTDEVVEGEFSDGF